MGSFDALSKLTGFTLAVDIQPFYLCMLSHSTLSRFGSFLNLHLFGLSVLIDAYLPATHIGHMHSCIHAVLDFYNEAMHSTVCTHKHYCLTMTTHHGFMKRASLVLALCLM